MRNQAPRALLVIAAVAGTLSSIHGVSDTFATIHVPGALATFSYGINDGSQVVGSYLDAGSRTCCFLACTPMTVSETTVFCGTRECSRRSMSRVPQYVRLEPIAG
jgi:hypothetical protein